MTDQVSGAAPAAPQTPIAGIKAFLNANPQGAAAAERKALETPEQPETAGIAPTHSEAPETAAAPEEPATREDEGEPEQVEEEAESVEDDAQTEESKLSSFEDLEEAAGLDREAIMGWTLPIKVDGKDGTATIRDLVKSYQLDQHISKKLEALNTDRKTFESKRAEAEKLAITKLETLEKGISVLSQALEGEFANVEWTKLQTENPAEFNAKYVSYQQRFAEMQRLAQQIEGTKAQQKAAQEAQAKAWAEEQETLLKAKVPEWNDDKQRSQDKAAIAEYAKGLGITKEELDSIQDHRVQIVLRDALKWSELQKQKPATLKKVKAAPKLLKPGTKQSRESRENLAANADRARLAKSGRVNDAAKLIKRQIFGTRN